MIRAATDDGWMLVTHPDHARLAGRLADAWGNARFAPPEPFAHVREAVCAHDDGWRERDDAPVVTREGRPGAFSRELVGAYSAFEEIDLADYLKVRGRALDAVARRDPYAAVIVSMHTVNLLTEQADLATLRPADRPLHAAFVAGQRQRQSALAAGLLGDPALAGFADAAHFERAFRFLQCCDSFSLMACVNFDRALPLRHAQPDRDGRLHPITCTPRGGGGYALDPWPLRETAVRLSVPARRVRGKTFASLEDFRAAFAAAETAPVESTLTPA
jgi:hypothetical protein